MVRPVADAAAVSAALVLQLLWDVCARAALGRGSVGSVATPAEARSLRKARAWLLTLSASVVLTLAGCVYFALAVSALVSGGFRELVTSDGPAGRAVTAGFVATLLLDLAVGCADYPEHLALGTGWVHHFAYVLLCGSFLHAKCVNAFLVYALCELPTVVLAAGSIAPKLRRDVLFGATFAATRLGWCVVLLCAYGVHAPAPKELA